MIKLPVMTYRKDVDIKTVNGQSVFDLREQILTIFGRDAVGLPLREFFAEPVTNEVKGEISWYSQASGRVVLLRDLDPESRADIMGTISRIDVHLKNAADRLVQSAPQLGWLRDATTAMLSAPDVERSIFLVGAVPVLTQWGCVPFGADPALYRIIVQDGSRAASRLPSAVSPPPSDAPPIPTTSNLTAEVSASSVASVDQMAEEATSAPAEDFHEEAAVERDTNDRQPFLGSHLWATLIGILLLLLLILGLYLNFLFSERSQLAAIDASRKQVDQLWDEIEQRAQQCRTADLDQLTPQTVQRDLERHSVQIGQQLNVSLVWTAAIDLDLAITQPNNVRIDYANPVSRNGTLDIDANRKVDGQACLVEDGRTPVENISWNGAIPSGSYRIEVNLFDMCGIEQTANFPFKLIINRNGEAAQELVGHVGPSSPTYRYSVMVQ